MDPLPAPLESAALRSLREHQTVGMAVCAFDRDGILFAGGVGDADRRRGELVTSRTVFRVASISKLLTTTLILTLVESGEVDLDAPVNRYLPPELRIADPSGAPASSPVRTLLSHTSGLPVGVRGVVVGNPLTSRLVNGRRVRTLADAIAGLHLSHPAGERIVYSNPAFNVLGAAAAHVLGTPFEAAATERVLAPLGMTGAEFTPHRQGPGIATPYGAVIPPGVSDSPVGDMRLVATPMGGLTTSVEDLARFGRMVLERGRLDGDDILSSATLQAATSLEAVNHPDLDQGYGLGFKVRPWRGRTLVGHDGNMPGVATQLVVSPADGVGAVALTNGYSLAVPHEMVTLTLEHLLGLAPEVAPGSPVPSPDTDRRDWEALGRRVEGAYRVRDATPPGLLGRAADVMLRVRVTHESGGRLRIDGNPGSGGPAWLQPDGELGRYRMAAAVDPGTRAVIEERADGTHLWLGHAQMLSRR